MSGALRHAIYWVPAPGAFARFGAGWLGWDMARGEPEVQPDVPGLPRPLAALTEAPRRYGFHATLKAPFRLAPGRTEAELDQAVGVLARKLTPARADGLVLARLGSFLALVPQNDQSDVGRVAAEAVEALDAFRAPLTDSDLARRRAGGLSVEEEANLLRWGYPHVMDTFRFHVTLTGPLAPREADAVEAALTPRLEGLLPSPFVLDAIAHVTEDADGRFRLLHRYPLSG